MSMRKRTPSQRYAMRSIVNVPEKDRATDTGSMHKNSKDRECGSGDRYPCGQTDRQTYSSHYFATAPADEVTNNQCVAVNKLTTRHRASTSMHSLTFRVRVATPAHYGRNGTASLQITSHTQQAHRFYRWCVRACVRSACGVRWPGGLPLGSATRFHNVLP